MKSNWNKLPVTETVDRNHLGGGVLLTYGMKIRQMKTSKQNTSQLDKSETKRKHRNFLVWLQDHCANKINAIDESTVHGGLPWKSYFFSTDVFHATGTRDITSKPDAYLGRRSLHIFKAVHPTPLHSMVGEKPQTTQFSW